MKNALCGGHVSPYVPQYVNTFSKEATCNKKKRLFTSKLDIDLRKKLVKCDMWTIALYCAETWALWKMDQKYLGSLKCGAGEGWGRSVGPIV
jgi:hypothetical protein